MVKRTPNSLIQLKENRICHPQNMPVDRLIVELKALEKKQMQKGLSDPLLSYHWRQGVNTERHLYKSTH